MSDTIGIVGAVNADLAIKDNRPRGQAIPGHADAPQGQRPLLHGRIVVVGSINTDLVISTPRIPAAGETLMARGFALRQGGKGANQAVAAVRVGCTVDMVGRVGDDSFGVASRQSLQSAGVGVEHVLKTPGQSSGVATILVEPHGENRILVVSGANAHVGIEDVPMALLEGAAMLVLQLEIPIETVYRLIETSPIPVLLNTAPAAPLDLHRLRGLAYLVPNQQELATISGLPTERMDDVVIAARHLMRSGIGCVITTLGAEGAMFVTRQQVLHVQAPHVDAIDTTGAGDGFIGCLVAHIAHGVEISDALTRAVRYASRSVTRMGAQESYGEDREA